MRNNTIVLILVLLLIGVALFIALPIDHPGPVENLLPAAGGVPRDLKDVKLGLDLRGGTQVLLEADLIEGQSVEAGSMDTAKTIVENRVNGLGVAEAIVQLQGEERIIVELPGVSNPDQAVETIRSTGQLEFVDPQGTPMAQGMIINTTNHPNAAANAEAAIAAGTLPPGAVPYPDQVFETVMTGDILRNASRHPRPTRPVGDWFRTDRRRQRRVLRIYPRPCGRTAGHRAGRRCAFGPGHQRGHSGQRRDYRPIHQ